MKLYTKRGDGGLTSLFDGSEVRKDDLRVAAYGTVDELNACIGLAASLVGERPNFAGREDFLKRLATIQSELFSIGADLATPASATHRGKVPDVSENEVQRLESWIDEAVATVAPLKSFILPGGDLLAAQLHVCRTVCRRAERLAVTLSAGTTINPHVMIYLNRLSDLFFAWARWANHVVGVPDIPWINPKA